MVLKFSKIAFFLIGFAKLASSQSSLLDIQMMNKPQNQIISGKISGDRLIPTEAVTNRITRRFIYHLTEVAVSRKPVGWKRGDIEVSSPLIANICGKNNFVNIKGERARYKFMVLFGNFRQGLPLDYWLYRYWQLRNWRLSVHMLNQSRKFCPVI